LGRAYVALFVCVLSPTLLQSQSRSDLFECEGCEAIHERSHDGLSWSTVIPGRGEPGDRLILSGRVLKPDGKTPAPGVVVYAYHTNAAGIYPTRGNEKGWGRRHGYLRGWVMTNEAGQYRFETIRPGAYPNRTDPAHIHVTIKEPNRREYWIDEVVFEGDPHVNERYRSREQKRGGTGIVRLTRNGDGVWLAERDIVLER